MKDSQSPKEKDDFRNDSVTWASLCHFSAFMGIVWWIPFGNMWIPVGQIIGPFGVWLVKRKVDPFVDFAGREALNFQIHVTLSALLLSEVFNNIFSLVAIWIIVLGAIFMVARAGVVSSRGEIYRYPVPMVQIFPTKSLAATLMKNKSTVGHVR
jgi:uncharacterized Tic20 family protein